MVATVEKAGTPLFGAKTVQTISSREEMDRLMELSGQGNIKDALRAAITFYLSEKGKEKKEEKKSVSGYV